ncbi:hypothetical protein [Paeniclostridium hominis]|uniref:hypothetical protein n=1 Tax=Paeniclostridium hominis TaxID=2764329 RepID=UPI0022E06961|nr:hypothetical protein [Paeniclostridium hominis]
MALNNETYFEFDSDLNEGFTTIPNYILNDTKLTYKAVGVYVQILQYRNSGKHKVYLKSLANYRKDKKSAVSSALKELEENGYLVRIQLRNEKGHMNGVKYIVRMKPNVESIGKSTSKPKAENPTSDYPTSENTPLKIKYNKKENDLKNKNNDDDEATKLINLYKTFKLEKRIMPHTTNLLKANTHISLDVFEQIFINASEDGIVKKYKYIKTIIDDLNTKNVTTLSDFEKYNQDFKNKKNNSESKGSYVSSRKKTTAHEINQTYKKYESEELEQRLKESQRGKFIEPKKTKFHNFKDSLDQYRDDFFDQFSANLPNDGKNDDWSY